jgi:hypothetical protein
MTRKALARRIAEVLFNEPATRRGAGAAPNPKGCADFGRVLCCSLAYHREKWEPLLSAKGGFERIAPILMTSDPDEWEKKPILNPFTELTPWELGDVLKIGQRPQRVFSLLAPRTQPKFAAALLYEPQTWCTSNFSMFIAPSGLRCDELLTTGT